MGGGAAVSTPLLALAVPPVTAAAVMLPVLCLMDLAGIRAYIGKWDRHAMRILLTAGIVGCGFGALTFRHISEHAIRILLGVISIGFLAWTFMPRRPSLRRPGDVAGWFWGTLAGFTSFVTHAGSPPMMVYLVPQRFSKETFVATSLVFFAAINYAKVIPYLWLGLFDARVLLTAAALVPVGVAGIYAGQRLQRIVSPRWFYRVIYTLLLLTGSRLLYEGITGLLRSSQ